MLYSFSKNKNDGNLFRSFVPSFLLPSFLASFVPCFLPKQKRRKFTSFVRSFVRSFIHSFVRSFVRSFVLSFFRSFVPSFLHFIGSFLLSFIRSFVPSSLPSFLFLSCPFCYFVRSFVSIRQTLSHLKKHLLAGVHSTNKPRRDKKLQTDMCTQRRPRSAWASVQSDQSSLSMVLSY